MKIDLVQGDTSPTYKFQRKKTTNEVITTKSQNMYVTFKRNNVDKDVIFQKRLDNNTIYFNEEDYYYSFKIESKDTQDLPYGIYGFDIAIINEHGEKKTLLLDGVLEILSHYTKKENE